jgi:RNA polymerase sigma factor (sigma-70 family)
MENFEQLALQYQPMIHKIISSLHIYKNKDSFYQTGLIGLWEAYQGFDTHKGLFRNYAYTIIKSKMLAEMNQTNKYEENAAHPKEEFWIGIEDPGCPQPLEADELLSYCQGLTEKETKWVLATFLEDLSVKEIAEREQVTVSAVKQWKLGAIKKMRAQMN